MFKKIEGERIYNIVKFWHKNFKDKKIFKKKTIYATVF